MRRHPATLESHCGVPQQLCCPARTPRSFSCPRPTMGAGSVALDRGHSLESSTGASCVVTDIGRDHFLF